MIVVIFINKNADNANVLEHAARTLLNMAEDLKAGNILKQSADFGDYEIQITDDGKNNVTGIEA